MPNNVSGGASVEILFVVAAALVDPDGRVHGVGNLYVAGSSVFPTSGIANPTLTILALVMRLADHLTLKMGAGR